MQVRHRDAKKYFEECALSCQAHYIPFIKDSAGADFGAGYSVLEVGCAKGGNLVPFAGLGCEVTGIDIHKAPVDEARIFFSEMGLAGTFIHSDILEYHDTSRKFDLIIMRDVIEHIAAKEALLNHLRNFLKKDGVIFIAFPAWQMPFGGHQQVAESKVMANFPYIHLLPRRLYRFALKSFGESEAKISGLLEIKDTRITVESFTRLVSATNYETAGRKFYLINPHYEVKFGLKPRILWPAIGAIPYFRNFLITTCFCLLRNK